MEAPRNGKPSPMGVHGEMEHDREGQVLRLDDAASFVAFLLRVRKAVGQQFGFDLCGNPALDMLLDLYSSVGAHRATSLSSLSHAANVPARTALSWIHRMVDRGLLILTPDLHDRRCVHVELSPRALAAFARFFENISA